MSTISNKVSLIAILIYAVVVFTWRDSYRPYEHSYRLVAYDMEGYYSYLQALFIYNDLEFKFVDDNPQQCMKRPVLNSKGDTVFINKYSIGPAILGMPFFLLGHLEAYWHLVPRDGLSYTYLFWMITGVILYIILALFLLRSILLRYYDDRIVAVTLLTLGLGTNLLHYTVFEFLMSHAYSFFLFALSLYLAINWIEKPRMRTFLFLSFVCGLLGVTRLPNMVFFLVVAFWGVYDKTSLLLRVEMFKTHKRSIFIGVFVFLLPFIPQVAYWYAITGRFYVNGYSENYEYFYWTVPMIAEVLIGYRKGWLIYTPIMIFGFLGFITLYKEKRELFWAVFLFSVINIYVVSCWSCWWYGGSFGMRALIEGSVVFSLPMASFFTYLSKKSVVSYISSIIVVFFMLLNIFQSHQYYYGAIHYCSMTRAAYWDVFGVMPPLSKEQEKSRDEKLKDPTAAEARREVYESTIW